MSSLRDGIRDILDLGMNLLFLGRHWRIKCLPRKVCIVDTDCQGCIVISLQAMEHML